MLPSTVLDDGAGFKYLLRPNATFIVVASATRPEVVGRVIVAEGEYAETWEALVRMLPPDQAAIARAMTSPTEAGPSPDAGDAEVGWIEWANGVARDAGDRFWGGASDEGEAPASDVAPAGEQGEAPDAGGSGVEPTDQPEWTGDQKDNLTVAKKLAEDTSPSHPKDPEAKVAGFDATGADRKNAILEGRVGDLKSLMCGEFTAATLQEAGWKLSDPAIDPASGLRIGYLESSGRLYIVKLYDLVAMWEEATYAVMLTLRGDAKRIEPGSVEYEKIIKHPPSNKDRFGSEALMLGTGETYLGKEHKDGDRFGAGLVAELLGGNEVAPADRKPGDVQQRVDVTDGKYGFSSGHSSTVAEVWGTGTAWLGSGDSPKVEGEGASEAALACLAPGWYRIPPSDSKLTWFVNEQTAPSRVAEIVASNVRLVDSSDKRGTAENRDATGLSDKFEVKLDESGHSIGRLPNSPWCSWQAQPSVEAEDLQTALDRSKEQLS